MSRLVKIFTIIMGAYSVSAFTIEADNLTVAQTANLYTARVSCASTASNIFIGIKGCSPDNPCTFVRGTTATLSIGFTSSNDVPRMRFVYQVYTGDSFQRLYYAEDLTTDDHSEANQPFFYAADRVVPQDVVPGNYALFVKIFSTMDSINPLVCVRELLFTVA